MSIESKAFEAYKANRELKPKYHLPENMWIDWFVKGYERAEKDFKETNEVEILKDQVESLKAALIAKDESHKIEIGELKKRAAYAYLEAEDYDEFVAYLTKK